MLRVPQKKTTTAEKVAIGMLKQDNKKGEREEECEKPNQRDCFLALESVHFCWLLHSHLVLHCLQT